MRSRPEGHEAAIVGEVRAEPEGMVFIRTSFGGTRVVDMLTGDPLPRICWAEAGRADAALQVVEWVGGVG
jgi:hypothetical protein